MKKLQPQSKTNAGIRLTVAVDYEICNPEIIDNGFSLEYKPESNKEGSVLLGHITGKVSQNFLKIEDFIIPNDNT